MSKLRSLEDLSLLRDNAQQEIVIRQRTGTEVIVGMGTCGIAAGARETMQAVLEELEKRDIEARVAQVGCVGMCSKEPLVDIQQAGEPRVTYVNVSPEMVPRLIEEHLVNGRVIQEWVFGRVAPEGIGTADRQVLQDIEETQDD